MTSPQGDIPEGAYVGTAGQSNSITDLNNLTEAEAKNRMLGQVAPSFERHRDGVWQDGGLLSHIADLLFGSGQGAPATRLADGMTALNNRLDLMDDVSGYGGMIMTHNHRFTSSNVYKTIPFNSQYGPHTPWSVTVDTSGNRFILKAGTWSVSLLLSVPSGTLIGSNGPWFRPALTVYQPDGVEYLNQWLDWQSGAHPHAFFAQIPLVIPDDSGFYIRARFTTSATSWRLLGGTDRSKFWVNRWDMRTDNNNIIINPPDGPDV